MISSESTISSLLWSQLESTSTYAAIIPIVLGGGITLFKHWVPTEDSIRTRVNTRIDTLRENINILVNGLLMKAVLSLDPKKLRGDTTANPPEPDAVGDCLSEIFKILKLVHCLEVVLKRNSYVHTYLYWTVAFGIVSFLIVNLVSASRPYLALLCYVVILSQIITVGLIRRFKKQLETYEQSN
jgi:hypothetical protein